MQDAIDRSVRNLDPAESTEYESIRTAVHNLVGGAPVAALPARPQRSFVHAADDETRYSHGDDIYAHAQRVLKDIKSINEDAYGPK